MDDRIKRILRDRAEAYGWTFFEGVTLVPSSDSSYDLGNTSRVFKDVYMNNNPYDMVFSRNIVASGSR